MGSNCTAGAPTVYPFGADYSQEFCRSLGDGAHLEIGNWGPERLMSWVDLEETVEGLSIFFLRKYKLKQV